MERLWKGGEGAATVAVYLFDLSLPNALLLDGESQVKPFNINTIDPPTADRKGSRRPAAALLLLQAAPLDHHAAVAVRSRFSLPVPVPGESSFQCQGRPVRLDPGSIARPMLAAILQVRSRRSFNRWRRRSNVQHQHHCRWKEIAVRV